MHVAHDKLGESGGMLPQDFFFWHKQSEIISCEFSNKKGPFLLLFSPTTYEFSERPPSAHTGADLDFSVRGGPEKKGTLPWDDELVI